MRARYDNPRKGNTPPQLSQETKTYPVWYLKINEDPTAQRQGRKSVGCTTKRYKFSILPGRAEASEEMNPRDQIMGGIGPPESGQIVATEALASTIGNNY